MTGWRTRIDPRLRALIREAELQGWRVGSTAKSHIRFTAPDGRTVIASGAGHHLEQHYARTLSRLRALGFIEGGSL